MKKIYLIANLFLLGAANLSAQINLNIGLNAQYYFTDESLEDSGPYFLNLINNNGATPVDDRFGNPNSAYQFDGVDDYLSASNDPNFTLGYGATLALWVKLSDVNTPQILVGKLSSPPITLDGGYLLGVKNGQIHFQTWIVGSTEYSILDGTILPNEWTHIAVTFQSTDSITLLVNGQVISSITVPDALDANTNDFVIGVAPYDPSMLQTSGVIDDIKIYSRKLNNAELNAVYSEVVTGNLKPNFDDYSLSNSGNLYTLNVGTNQKINKLTISDISGRVISNDIVNNKQSENIDLTAFPKGIYFLNVQTNLGEKSFKIMN